MNKLMVSCALLSAIVFMHIDPAHSECCHIPLKCTEGSHHVDRCYDCTAATSYCGNGKCNVFGCNCDGGCRKGDSTLWCWKLSSGCKGKFFYEKLFSQTNEHKASQLLRQMDTNGDGRVDYIEARDHLSQFGPKDINFHREFNKLDTNRDGFISLTEIDG